jgi:hypothetical protein
MAGFEVITEGLDRRITGGCAAEAASNNRHGLCTMRFQVANCCEYVILKRRVIEISLAWTRRAAVSTEIDCPTL